MPISHAKRQRNKVENASTGGSGIGGRVPVAQMVKAAQIWLELEHGHSAGYKVSALAVGKRIGLSVAPEWLATDRFTAILEVERFKLRVLRLKALPELTELIKEVIDLGLVEAQKRLILSPGEIPNSTLFGDILFKLPKMVQDFTVGERPSKSGDILISVVKEINLIADPRAREQVRLKLLGQFDNVAKALNTAEAADATGEVTDALAFSVGSDPRGDSIPDVDEGSVDRSDEQSRDSGSNSDTELWDDPALG